MASNFNMTTFLFDNVRVYDALFIKDKVPTYFVGCSATILKIIEKKNIPIDKYFFASYTVKNGYKSCSAEYKTRRLLINAVWVEENVPGFSPDGKSKVVKLVKPVKEYLHAPDILHLEDEEKFKDENGDIIDIEVRGERHYDKIWFKARDIEKMLDLDDITKTVTDIKSSYERDTHYQTFHLIPLTRGSGEGEQIKNINKNELSMFLSYWGLVKMLFGRMHPIAIKFQRWAIEKLFAIQMGTKDQKEDLAADVLGVTPKALKAVLNTNVGSMPVVYMFQLGSVKSLRNTFNIPNSYKDTDIVLKYGLTQDLRRRTTEHEAAFKKLEYDDGNSVQIGLKYHVYIDPFYLSNAETDIKNYFVGAQWHLKHPKFTEICIVPDHMLTTLVHNEFKRLGNAYAGKLQDLQTQLSNEQKINMQLKSQLEAQESYHRDSIEQLKAHACEMREQYEARIQAIQEMNLLYKQLALMHKEQ